MSLLFAIVTRFSISRTGSPFVRIGTKLKFVGNFGRLSSRLAFISLASNSARELPFWIVCACERVTSTVLQVSIVLVESRLGSLSKRSWRLLKLRPIISLARRRELFHHFGSVFGQIQKPVQFNGNSICSDFNSKMFES